MQQMRWLRKNGRITGKAAYNLRLYQSTTGWDLGMFDANVDCVRPGVGREVRVIDYLDTAAKVWKYYAESWQARLHTVTLGRMTQFVSLAQARAVSMFAAQFGYRLSRSCHASAITLKALKRSPVPAYAGFTSKST